MSYFENPARIFIIIIPDPWNSFSVGSYNELTGILKNPVEMRQGSGGVEIRLARAIANYICRTYFCTAVAVRFELI
jgi:hypothetical protein